MDLSHELSPSVLRAKVVPALLTGAAGGVLTLPNPARIPAPLLAALCVGSGAIGALAGWFGTGGSAAERPEQEPGRELPAAHPPQPLAVRLAAAGGAAAVGAGGVKLFFVVDAAIHRALVRRGVTRPRALMAVAVGLYTTATVLVEPAPRRAVAA